MADALTFHDEDETTETRVFIRHMDNFFDCLNVRNHEEGVKKRKPWREAYFHSWDERFKVSIVSSVMSRTSFFSFSGSKVPFSSTWMTGKLK